MALWEGFLDCWKDFADRIDHGVCLIDHFKSHAEHLQLATTRHLLSIGPGTGEVDAGLVELLPTLVSYTGVDPDDGVLETLSNRLDAFPQLQKTYVTGVLETYPGPLDPPDIVLMSHVAYYFPDTFPQQIRRALSWLDKERGRILLVHDRNTFHKLIASEFDVHMETFDLITVKDVRCHLVEMDVNFTESEVPYTLDLSSPGRGYYDFLSVMLNRRASRAEADMALGLIRQVAVPGTQKVLGTQSVFEIQPRHIEDTA